MSPPDSPSTPTPYYTVVGSSADRVVATDMLDDYSWTNYVGSYYWSYATASTSASAQKAPKSGGGLVGLGKSLTRKVSSRWKRTGSVVTTEGRSQGEGVIKTTMPSAGPATPAQAPQAFSERSGSAGLEEPAKTPLEIGREQIKRLRSRHTMHISVDHLPGDGKAPSPLPTTPTPDTPTSFESVRVPRRLVKSRPSLSSADLPSSRGPLSCIPPSASTSRCTPSEKESGGKLWKLMKRISTGGLRDKYHSHSSSKSQLSNYSEESLSHASSSANDRAPPVPALPKGLRVLLPSASSPASPISVSSDGYSPRNSGIPKTSCDVQGRGSQTRIVEKDRSASSPIPMHPSSSSPAGSQKRIIHRLRPISSVGALRRRPSTSTGFSASVSASMAERGPIPSSTPSGQTKPQIPSRPSTANATSSSLESRRFFSSIGNGRSRSVQSKHSSISSVDDANGHNNNLHPSPQNQQHNQSYQHFHQQLPQQQQSNSKPNVNNGLVPVPPVLTNILAKHIVPPGELSKGPPSHGSTPSIVMTSKDKGQGTRRKEGESILTRLMQSGGGNANGKGSSSSPGRSADNGGPSRISGLSIGRPSKVGLYLELPGRSATSPLPRMNDLDISSGSIRVPTPIPSPGRSASLGGFEWSIARSPEYELPSLPVPPRKRAAERTGPGDDGASVNGNEKVPGRGRSLTVAASPLSSPTSSCVPSTSSPPRVESPSSISSSAAGSGEYFSPALSTFGRVVGKQFGMERIEDPLFVSTPASVSSVSSSMRSARNRRISISGSISHFLSKSSRPGSSSASAVARSYSSPSSSDLPLSSSLASVPSCTSQPSLPLPSKPIPPPSTSPSPGTFNTLLRKLSFSGNAPASLPPARPVRNPTRSSMSISTTPRDSRREEKEKKAKLGGAKQSGKDNDNGALPVSTPSASDAPRSSSSSARRFIRNAETATDTDFTRDHNGSSGDHRKSQSYSKSNSLTEKEKRARWKDLLARSERAGGTIHLSADGEGLLSDKMSMRAASLVTGEGEEDEDEGDAVLEGADGY